MDRAPTLLPAGLVLLVTGGVFATWVWTSVPPRPTQPPEPSTATDETTAQRTIAFTPPPPPLPECEGWPHNLEMRAAMQLCSWRVNLETNERWELHVRAEVVDGRPTALTFTSIERICDACFDYNAEGRATRGRQSRRELMKCVREHVADARFSEQRLPRCSFETRWWITHDW